ncbi:hypothetical protein [Streptomyces scopuliridis]|uniref:hypothetical protein n=1 Tax=Streptomyces scopuliridis TaxID=452529 RepID=UPI0035DD71D8
MSVSLYSSEGAERPADEETGDFMGLVPCAHSAPMTTSIGKEDTLTTTADWDALMTSLGLEPSTRPHANRGPGSIAECGTESGAQRHYRLGEALCDPCRAARRAAQNRQNKARREGRVKPKPVIRCGTHQGANRHWDRGEQLCDPCRAAYNAWQAEYRAARRRAAA